MGPISVGDLAGLDVGYKARQALPAALCEERQISMHVMPCMHKKPDFLDMTEIRV